jgi:hypothetical protein
LSSRRKASVDIAVRRLAELDLSGSSARITPSSRLVLTPGSSIAWSEVLGRTGACLAPTMADAGARPSPGGCRRKLRSPRTCPEGRGIRLGHEEVDWESLGCRRTADLSTTSGGQSVRRGRLRPRCGSIQRLPRGGDSRILCGA